jgi:putative chitinase
MYQSNRPEITDEAAEESISQQTEERVGEVAIEERDGQKFAKELPESYTVMEGDHLWSIAQANYGSGYNWVDIARENNLVDPGQIEVGQELRLPDAPVIEIKTDAQLAQEQLGKIEGDKYTVEEGNNLWEIALRSYADGYAWTRIAEANNLANPDLIEVGQELSIPR